MSDKSSFDMDFFKMIEELYYYYDETQKTFYPDTRYVSIFQTRNMLLIAHELRKRNREFYFCKDDSIKLTK